MNTETRGRVGWALLIALLVPVAAGAQNARVSATQQTPYLGDTMMTVAVPANGNLQSFQVVAHQGKYRMGSRVNLMDRAVLNQLGQKERSARMAGVHVQRSGDQLLMDLLTLGENSDIITVENMAALYENAKRPLRVNAFMRPWAPAIERAARGALNDAAYREVFCVDEAPCPLDRFFGPRPYDITGLTPVWGAGYNEFRFRAAYQVFVDKYLRELVDFGAAISRDVYVVGQARMSRYDFNTGSYTFRGVLGTRMKAPPGGLQDISTANVDIDFVENASGELQIPALAWKLSREEAEAFRETMQSRKLNSLFALVEGQLAFDEVDRAAMNNDRLLRQTTHVKLTGPTLTLYFDAELTEQVVSFPLR